MDLEDLIDHFDHLIHLILEFLEDLEALSHDVPNNAGVYRCITIKAPKGSILNPEIPAAVAARALTGYRVVDAVMGHVDSSMAGVYRQRISDERLEAVVDVVYSWLFAKKSKPR